MKMRDMRYWHFIKRVRQGRLRSHHLLRASMQSLSPSVRDSAPANSALRFSLLFFRPTPAVTRAPHLRKRYERAHLVSKNELSSLEMAPQPPDRTSTN